MWLAGPCLPGRDTGRRRSPGCPCFDETRQYWIIVAVITTKAEKKKVVSRRVPRLSRFRNCRGWVPLTAVPGLL